jgi:hypothetical protein
VSLQTGIDSLATHVANYFRDTVWPAINAKAPKADPTFNGPVALTHQASPANPAAGTLAVFAKTDNKLYTRTSAGVEAELGSEGGAGYMSPLYAAAAGSGVTYTLPGVPPHDNALTVIVGGVIQPRAGAYSWAGTTLTLSEDPGTDLVEMHILSSTVVLVNTVSDGAINNAKLENMAAGSVKGRLTAGIGAPEDITMAQLATSLGGQGVLLSSAIATAAQYRANTTGKVLTTDQVWASAVPVDLGTPSGNTTLDFGAFVNGFMNPSANFTLFAVAGRKAGQSGQIRIFNPSGRTMSVNSSFFGTPGGAGITLGINRNILSYYIDDELFVHLFLSGKVMT